MDTSPTFLAGGRYELLASHDTVEVRDHEPWQRCWACGSTDNEPGETFCMRCGAVIEPRIYQGVLTSRDEHDGLHLIATVEDPFVRSVLPIIWDEVEEDDRKLILLDNNGYLAATTPIDELDAIRVGLDLAQVLTVLHRAHIALGKVTSRDVAFTTAGKTHLMNAPHLQRIGEDNHHACRIADLHDLASLLEELTGTPRTTRRLEDGDAEEHETTQPVAPIGTEPPALNTILRQIRTGSVEDASHLANLLDDLLIDLTCPTFLQQEVGADSNTGMIRDHNEDSLLVLNLCMNNVSVNHGWGLYIVADGMGGHAAGEIASRLAIRSVADFIMREYLLLSLDPEMSYNAMWVHDIVRRAVLYANEAIRNEARICGNDMGTTLTMALVIGDRATIANVGDSRTLLYHEGKLRRISRDHSLVMRLVELGQISEEDIYTHPQRNAVLRSLGDQSDIEVDIFQERLQSGDKLLVCSDGQWEMTRTPEMERILARYDHPNEACHELIKAANHAGGEDNITSIVVCLR